MIQANKNVISLHQKKEDKAYVEALESMTFGELIDESSEIIRQLQDRGIENDLAFKSRSLLQELAIRAGKQNHHMNSSIKKMKSALEMKLIDINS
jgi:hypothetical protein